MKPKALLTVIGTVFTLLCCPTLWADIRLPTLISDAAVLQRDTPLKLWGWAEKGESVTVYLDGQSVGTTITGDKKWAIDLAPQAAGGPHQITVSGKNRINLSDIYFGDVWLASGQSNMELPMERVKYTYAAEVANANNPLIRQFSVPRSYDFDGPREDFSAGSWMPVDTDHIGKFSAVAYFFAKAIQQRHSIPIGIILNAVGGSTAESWMSEQALKAFPHHLRVATSYRDKNYLHTLQEADKKAQTAWYAALDRSDLGLQGSVKWYAPSYDASTWRSLTLPAFWADTEIGAMNGAVWFRKTVTLPQSAAGKPARLWLGRIIDADTTYVNGAPVGNIAYQWPPRRYPVAPNILRAGDNTIAIRVISNAGNGGFIPDKPYWLEVDGKKYPLTGDWRYRIGATTVPVPRDRFVEYLQPLGFYNAMFAPLKQTKIKGALWYQGESNVGRADEYAQLLPALIADWRQFFSQGDFPFLLVQLANYLPEKTQPVESSWAELRQAQLKTLAVHNTAMAVTIDIGEWNDIHPLNKKTVGDRLALAARKLAYGEGDVVHSGPLVRCITIDQGKATLHFDHTGSGLMVKGDTLQGFALAGADGHYQWARAELNGNWVELELPEADAPFSVRYAWADNPEIANLYNKEGLPASPFTASQECPR